MTPCLGGTVLPKFEQFIKERQYLRNVTLATVEWHTWIGRLLPEGAHF
jgi:hypothetical protein